jgi:hypothetical protein
MAGSEQSSLLSLLLTSGTVINFFVFGAEIPLTLKLVRERDATRYSFYPALSLLFMSSLWGMYTIYVQPLVAFFVGNGVAITMGLIYLGCHFIFTKDEARRRKLMTLVLGLCSFSVILYVSAFSYAEFDTARTLCASVTVSVNVAFFVAPLKQLYLAAKLLDTSRVPTLLSVVTFLGSLNWTAIGFELGDPYIRNPNVCGLVLTTAQLGILMFVRMRRRQLGFDRGVQPLADKQSVPESGQRSAHATPEVTQSTGFEPWAATGAAAMPLQGPQGQRECSAELTQALEASKLALEVAAAAGTPHSLRTPRAAGRGLPVVQPAPAVPQHPFSSGSDLAGNSGMCNRENADPLFETIMQAKLHARMTMPLHAQVQLQPTGFVAGS